MSFQFNPFTGTLDIVGTGGGGSSAAIDITYDNTGSGLSATNVQDALDEIVSKTISNNNVLSIRVDYNNGDDTTGNGSVTNPYKNIEKAIAIATADPGQMYMLRASAGQHGTGEAVNWPDNLSICGEGATVTGINKVITYVATAAVETRIEFAQCSIGTQASFDLSPANQCIIVFRDGGYAVKRVDTATGAHYIEIADSVIGDLDVTGTLIITGGNFVNAAVIQTGGTVLIQGSVCGVPVDLYGTAQLVIEGSVLAGSVTGHTVGLDTPNLITDSASLLFGPSISGVNIVYSNKAQYEAFTQGVPSDWTTDPQIVSAALDELAARAVGTNEYNVEKFTLNGTDISNEYVTLSDTPTTATLTRLIVIGGAEQDYSVDFTVTGTQLSWSGLSLDGVLISGDKIIAVYN